MPLTNFPNGIFATPVVGARKFDGLWTSNVWFVDGTRGTAGNTGKEPKKAVSTLARAIVLARKDDTIYIAPQAVGVRYTENVTVPVTTHAGLSIIGTGNGFGNSVYQACSFKGVTSVDAPIMILDSSYANIENIHFYANAAQLTTGFGVQIRWNTGGGLNIGSAIMNCSFTTNPDSKAANGTQQPAIRLDSTEGILVQGNSFKDVLIGVSIGSTQSTTDAITIRNNQFIGAAANFDADVYVTDSTNLNIIQNVFGHALPAAAAGAQLKYIKVVGTVTGTIIGNYLATDTTTEATNMTIGGLIMGPNWCSGAMQAN